MSISEILKNQRRALNLTLLEVANMVGVTEATVQRWESGNIKNLRHERIVGLANALDVSPAYLMGWTDEPYVYDKKAAPAKEDGPSPLDAQLMDLLRFLTDDQKEFLLAQIKTLQSSQL